MGKSSAAVCSVCFPFPIFLPSYHIRLCDQYGEGMDDILLISKCVSSSRARLVHIVRLAAATFMPLVRSYTP